MRTMKKAAAVFLALWMSLSLMVTAFAEDVPALTKLDTSAVDGKMTVYRGIEDYFVVYPEPLEAESRLDIRQAQITCSREGIVAVRAEKVEEYRFGSVVVTGIRYGSTVVTVTEPQSGVSCSVQITVVPAFGYYVRNVFNFLNYLPYFLFMHIAKLFGQ